MTSEAISKAAAESLARGIESFNAGRFAEAAEQFSRAVAEGGGQQARFCLEHARRSLAGGTPSGGVRAPAAERALAERLAAADLPGAARLADGLFRRDPNAAYRLMRDFWLGGGFDGWEKGAGRSPWEAFFLSSQAWRGGRDLEALSSLHRARHAAPRHAWMGYFVAEILLRRLDLYALARREIERVAKQCPWLWEARCLRAEIGVAQGVADPLRGLAIEVPEGSRAAFLAWRGALQLWTGRYAAATSDLDAAASLGNPDARCWRGGALVMLGRPEEALRDLDWLLAADASDPEARVWRGEAHRRLGRAAEGLGDLDALLARSEDAPWALVNRALIRLHQGELEAARQDFSRLSPTTYLDQPDEETPVDRGLRRQAPVTLAPDRLKALLEEALRLARGCRRSDTHLNVGWMRAAGATVPSRPAPQARLSYWLRSVGVDSPQDCVFGAFSVSERKVKSLLGAS